MATFWFQWLKTVFLLSKSVDLSAQPQVWLWFCIDVSTDNSWKICLLTWIWKNMDLFCFTRFYAIFGKLSVRASLSSKYKDRDKIHQINICDHSHFVSPNERKLKVADFLFRTIVLTQWLFCVMFSAGLSGVQHNMGLGTWRKGIQGAADRLQGGHT